MSTSWRVPVVFRAAGQGLPGRTDSAIFAADRIDHSRTPRAIFDCAALGGPGFVGMIRTPDDLVPNAMEMDRRSG